MDTRDVVIDVRIAAVLYHRTPPENDLERVLRKQAATKLDALARTLEAGVARMLTDMARTP